MEAKKKMEKWQAKIEMTTQARDALQRICDEEGMLQIHVVSRVMLWFLRQEKLIRAAVLGHVTEIDPKILRAILEAEIQRITARGAGTPEAVAELEAETIAEIDRQHGTSRGRKAAS